MDAHVLLLVTRGKHWPTYETASGGRVDMKHTKLDKTFEMSKTDISHEYRAHCGLPVASFDIS